MCEIKMPAVCDSLASEALKTEMSDVCGIGVIEVDASDVEKIGQACFQVLVAAARTSGGIAIKNPSENFTSAVALTGLAGVLSLEAA
ncbi:STAS domain-containing protein [Qipengyuania sp.]|uniref:STAS domain-containing protein n=1 Tax=Qipengyuania sp. TaxID=2004515 RepID=UPI0035C83077